ncbi:helix-turn-helix transcriptional regulator [Intrasporangium sp. YIM S08009]|uniref:helix-turn-helix transcriptional regulator n=1 Tax=Intrasporangium zincisolvens TaxID=3080018 RepID=UPI002B05F990|nr:helix-turn-helix transcriptional regulator [Intrasporangium sp. YIM S08009]
MGTRQAATLLGAGHPREADVLRLAVDIARHAAADEAFAEELVQRIEIVLGADGGAGLTSFGPHVQTDDAPAVVTSEGCVVPLGQAERAAQYAGSHPAIAAMRCIGVTGPVRTSDHVRMDQFWDTPEFDAMHGWLPDGQFPVAIALHLSANDLVFLGLHRGRRDFTDDDLDALALIQSIVAPALTLNVRLKAALARLAAVEGDDESAGANGANRAGTEDRIASAAGQLPTLTARERQVLALAAQGLTSHAIGHRLGLSERTIRKHLSSVYAKTGLHGRAAATAWWAGSRASRSVAPRR